MAKLSIERLCRARTYAQFHNRARMRGEFGCGVVAPFLRGVDRIEFSGAEKMRGIRHDDGTVSAAEFEDHQQLAHANGLVAICQVNDIGLVFFLSPVTKSALTPVHLNRFLPLLGAVE